MQGVYNEVWLLLILFYIVISTIRFWINKYTLIPVIIASFSYLEDFTTVNWDNFVRFVTSDIIPHPIKTNKGLEETFSWV